MTIKEKCLRALKVDFLNPPPWFTVDDLGAQIIYQGSTVVYCYAGEEQREALAEADEATKLAAHCLATFPALTPQGLR